MSVSNALGQVDIDVLVSAIKREALARGDVEPFHSRTQFMLERGSAPPPPAAEPQLAMPVRISALRDWMPWHGRAFLVSAYRTLLRREPDPEGLASFSLALAQGRFTRWEVAGRLRLSSEGRARRVRIKGLWLGFALATTYRSPIVGPIVAVATRLLCLPAHLQDHAREDRFAAQLLLSKP